MRWNGESLRVVADVGRRGVGMADQAGVVHEGILRSVVDTETEGVDAQFDTFAFPPDVFLAVGGDTEKVMVLACEVALSPTRFDDRLCQDHYRIDPETFSRLAGKREI